MAPPAGRGEIQWAVIDFDSRPTGVFLTLSCRHEIREDGSLEIRNVQLEDAGNYHCVVKKDHAVYQQAATLRIGGRETIEYLTVLCFVLSNARGRLSDVFVVCLVFSFNAD